jgi:hypothetical protein
MVSAQLAMNIEALLKLHEDALSKVVTFSGTYEVSQGLNESKNLTQTSYMRDGQNVRIMTKDLASGRSDEYIFRGFEAIGLGRSRAGQPELALKSTTSDTFVPGDVWRELLIEYRGKNTERHGLRGLCKIADSVSVENDTAHSADLIVNVTTKQRQNNSWRLHFDKRKGFVVDARLSNQLGLDARFRIVKFEPWGDVNVFPRELQVEVYENGALKNRKSGRLTDIKFNEKIDPVVFQLAYPKGVKLYDRINGTIYDVDEKGQQIGPAERINVQPSPPNATIGSPSKVTVPGENVHASATGYWPWVGLAVLFLVPLLALKCKRTLS